MAVSGLSWLAEAQRSHNAAVAARLHWLGVRGQVSPWPAAMRPWAFLLVLPLAPVWVPAGLAFGLLVAVAAALDALWFAPARAERFRRARMRDLMGTWRAPWVDRPTLLVRALPDGLAAAVRTGQVAVWHGVAVGVGGRRPQAFEVWRP